MPLSIDPLFDTRCPLCNQPTVGNDEVITAVPDVLPEKCPNPDCGTGLVLVTIDDGFPVSCFDVAEARA